MNIRSFTTGVRGDEGWRQGRLGRVAPIALGILRLVVRKKKIVAIALVVLAVTAVWYFMRAAQTPEEKAAQELAAAIVAVEKLMILPEGDEPVLATITDAAALIAQQPFFAGSINGDQLLLYPKNSKAIIYSPSRSVVVNAGPIETGAPKPAEKQAQTPAVVAPSAPVTVEVRNGSGVAGRASSVAAEIGADAAFKVIAAADAKSNDYTRTVVVALSDTEDARSGANTLAAHIGGAVVATLPKGETSSDADIIIILGSSVTP